ncbi:MAG TPA: hypothetical protein VLX61_13505 [Anaerolineales bacterium]|nr:hypothetical protein [Anaerolineales bacterium]
MDFGEVLSKAWKITWKFKVLWIFGILAACGTSRGGSFNFNSNFQPGGNGFSGATPNLPPAVMEAMDRFVQLFENPSFVWKFVAIVLAVVCVMILVEIFIGTMGRIGLIKGSAEADAGAEKLGFAELWKQSTPYFWRVFWLSFLIGSPFVLVFLLLAAGAIAALIPLSNNSSNAQFLFILLPVLCVFCCVIFILAILVGFISTQAERAIVLEDRSILDGFRRGWEVLTKNLGPILIIWLITIAIGFVAAIVISLPLLLVMVPLVIAFISAMNNLNFSFTPWIVAFACIICAYTPVSWLFNGIIMTYLQSVWTLTYIRITRPKQEEQTPPALPTNA